MSSTAKKYQTTARSRRYKAHGKIVNLAYQLNNAASGASDADMERTLSLARAILATARKAGLTAGGTITGLRLVTPSDSFSA
jgi:hypothetical protein